MPQVTNTVLERLNPPSEIKRLFDSCPRMQLMQDVDTLFDLACGGADRDYLEVAYELPGGRRVVEATAITLMTWNSG